MNTSENSFLSKIVFMSLILFLSTSNLRSQEYALETWRFVPDLNDLGRANMISIDIDSDSIKELIYSSKGSGSLFKILDYNGDNYNEVYSSELFSKQITWMEVYDHDGDGHYNLFLAMENQKIEVFDIHARKFIDTIDLPFYADKFFIIDSDNNGETEILGHNGSGIFCVDMNGNLIGQKIFSGIQDIEIGNVDDDSDVELVVSAYESYVLNLKDLTTKWIYYGNFGYDIDLGDPNATGYNLIFGCVYNNIRAYDANLKSPLWEITLQNSINKIKIIDLEDDNNLELLMGTGEKVNALLCYDLKSRTLNWQKSIKSYGVHGFLNNDFDGDNVKELVYVCGNSYNYDESLVILDIFSDKNEFETQDYSNDFRFDLGDINNDKISDYFIVSKINYNGIESNFGVAIDGLTKKTISDKIYFKRSEFVQNVSITYYNNEHYILLVSQYGFIIYNFEKDKIVVDEPSSPNLISSGGFYIKNNLSKPQVFICLDDGRVRFYDFNISYCSTSWSTFSTYNSIYGCKIGNFDDDTNDEIAFQSAGILNIYDLSTHLLNGQYQLLIGGNTPYEIVDIDNNGEMDILYHVNYNDYDHKLFIKNMVTSETTSFPVNEIILQIASKNLDSDKTPEILILTKKRLYIYKIDGTILFKSATNNNEYYYDANEIKINDNDHDGHMEVIISTRFGIWEFKITQKYPDVLLPEVDKVNPGKDSKSVALNSELKIFFSEVIDNDSLDSKIILTDQAENNITFNSNFNEDKKMLLIKPVNNLPANHQIIVTISHTIKDLAGNFLDGNKNGKPDDENDNFSWSFFTGSEIDTVGPVFSEVAFLNKFYRGSIIKIEGIVSDSTESIVSEIDFIGYFIDSIGLYIDAKTVKPVDNFFDEAKEEFSFSLETSNFTSGVHKLFLISNDVLGNWSVTDGLPFEIITENPANWTKFDFDYYNTGSNSFSQLNFPLKLKHEFNFINQGYESNVGKPILVDNYLVYSINGNPNLHSLECLDINTKKIMWKKTFNISDKIFPPTYSDGLIFVQIGNHENSTLVSFDLISGEEKWSTKYSRQWTEDFGPVVYKDRVYIVEGYYATTLGAYDISNGKLIWRKEINKDMFDKWLPAFYNDTLYAFAKTLVAMNPETGKIYYKKDDIIPLNFVYFLGVGSPIVDTLNKQVLLTTGYSIHAFSLINHELSWSLKIDEGIFSNPALFEGKLYLMTINRILELNSLDGTIIWSYEVPYKSSRGYNTVVNNNMVVYSNQEISYLFNRDSRKLELIIEKGGAVIITDKYLVHSSLYGKLKVYEHNTTPVILFGSINIVDEIDCFGNSNGSIEAKVFGGIKPYHFKWNDPLLPDSNFVSNLRAGFYAVTISDNNNDTITFSIELPTPTELILTGFQTPSDLGLNTGSATVLFEGGTPPYMIIWDYSPFHYLPDLQNIPAGSYGVKVIDANGCEKYIVITVETKVGTDDQYLSEKIKVFPSLTSDDVVISSEDPISELHIDIVNSMGQVIDRKQAENFTIMSVSFRDHPDGMYFLKISDGKNQSIKKIYVTKR